MLPTAFDRWLADTLGREGLFTLFLILMEEAPATIVPIRSSYLHVIGPDITWADLVMLISEAESAWHSVAVFAAKAPNGGPMPDVEAQRRLASLQQAVIKDRMVVRKGELFDRGGRRLELSLLPDESF